MTVSSLNTAIAEMMTGSNTQPTDSTNLWVTMRHKSGTGVTYNSYFFRMAFLLAWHPASLGVALS